MKSVRSLPATMARHFVIAAIGVGAIAMPAQAQQNPAKQIQLAADGGLAPLELPALPPKEIQKKKFGNWTQQCDTRPGSQQEKCFITQAVVGTKDNEKHGLLGITIGYFGPDHKLGVIFRVPIAMGIFLPSGFKFSVPGVEAAPIPVQVCMPQGCSATQVLSPDTVTAMKKANAGTLELQTVGKELVRLPVSFKGFTAALNSLSEG